MPGSADVHRTARRSHGLGALRIARIQSQPCSAGDDRIEPIGVTCGLSDIGVGSEATERQHWRFLLFLAPAMG
jgi:hypothetical protein